MRNIKEIEKLGPLTATLNGKNGKLTSTVKEWEYAFDAVSDLIFIVDTNYMIKYINRALADKLNVNKEEVVGKPCYDIIHPCDDLLDTNGKEFDEEYFERLDSWVEYSRCPIKNDDDGLIGFICTLRDITDRKKALDTLKESEEKFRMLVEKSNDGIVIIQDELIKYMNPALEKMTGYSFEEAKDTSFINYIVSDEIEESLELYKKRIAGENAPSVHERGLVHENGNKMYTETNAALMLYKGKPADFVIIRDITERKLSEKKKEEEHQQLLSIFDSIDEVVYVTDPDTHEILYVNGATKKFFGTGDACLVGKKCYDVLQGLDNECSFCTNKHIFGENLGKVHKWEFQNRLNKRWYHCIDKAIRWPDGRMVRYEMAIDISDPSTLTAERGSQ